MRFEGNCAQFIYKKRPCFDTGELTFCAACNSKQGFFELGNRNRCAIQCHKGGAGTWPQIVKRLGHQFLTCAGFADEQYVGVRRTQIHYFIAQRFYRAGFADEYFVEAGQIRQSHFQLSFAIAHSLELGSVVQNIDQPSGFEGFFEKTIGTVLNCLHSHVDIAMGGHKNHGHVGFVHELMLKLDAGRAGHSHIAQQYISALQLHFLKNIFRFRETLRLKAGLFQKVA